MILNVEEKVTRKICIGIRQQLFYLTYWRDIDNTLILHNYYWILSLNQMRHAAVTGHDQWIVSQISSTLLQWLCIFGYWADTCLFKYLLFKTRNSLSLIKKPFQPWQWLGILIKKYRLSQKCVPLLCKSVVSLAIVPVKQIIYAQVVYFSLIEYHIFFVPSFYWKIQCLHFPAKGVHALLYFPAKYLLSFLSWIAHNLSSVLWISWKMHPVDAKRLSYLRAQASTLRSIGLSVKEISKKLKKSEHWVVKWSSRNDGFEDKKRTGRPKILNEAAKRILNKAKYKRGNSTRQLSQQLASKAHVGGKNTIWRFMTEKRRLETAEKAKETSAYSQAACSSTEIC